MISGLADTTQRIQPSQKCCISKIKGWNSEVQRLIKRKRKTRFNEAPTCSVDCHNFAEGACAQLVLCQHTELVLRPRLQPRHHQPGLSTRNWHRVPVVWTKVSSLWPGKKKRWIFNFALLTVSEDRGENVYLHWTVPHRESLFETAVVTGFPGHVSRGCRRQYMDIAGSVWTGACVEWQTHGVKEWSNRDKSP